MSQEDHRHNVEEEIDGTNERKCTDCGKSTFEMWSDVNDIDPTHRVSQQPHGKATMQCNICQMYVAPTMWDGHEVCPYHQNTMQTEEGPVRMYDEFDQDGN